MKRLVLLALLSLGQLGIAQLARAVEILRWERLPLAVPLVVGQERVIFIDRNVRVGLPQRMAAQLRVQSAGGAIYLRASEAMAPTRLQVQDVESGALILLDIHAEPAREGLPALEPVRIVLPQRPEEVKTSPSPEQPRATPVAVALTRYAAQQLYAPLRTIEPLPGITRVSLRRDLALDTLLPTLPVHAQALAAWRLEDQWVTAVKLRNTSARWLALDPRALQGDFLAATFQHESLGPSAQSTDTTVLYLVTRGQGLAASLLPKVSPIDAMVNMPAAAAAGQAEGAGEGAGDAK